MARNFELVVDREARLRHVPADGFIGLDPEDGDFPLEFADPALQRLFVGDDGFDFRGQRALAAAFDDRRAAVLLLVGHDRRGALRAVAIDGDGFESEAPALDVSIHDVLDRGRVRQIWMVLNGPERTAAAAIIRICPR